jgi:hypothetical protein
LRGFCVALRGVAWYHHLTTKPPPSTTTPQPTRSPQNIDAPQPNETRTPARAHTSTQGPAHHAALERGVRGRVRHEAEQRSVVRRAHQVLTYPGRAALRLAPGWRHHFQGCVRCLRVVAQGAVRGLKGVATSFTGVRSLPACGWFPRVQGVRVRFAAPSPPSRSFATPRGVRLRCLCTGPVPDYSPSRGRLLLGRAYTLARWSVLPLSFLCIAALAAFAPQNARDALLRLTPDLFNPGARLA